MAAWGWEAETGPVPTDCPQRAWEEVDQQVVGQLGPQPTSDRQGDQARPLLASVSVSVARNTVPRLLGPWKPLRRVGASPHATLGRPSLEQGSQKTRWSSQLCEPGPRRPPSAWEPSDPASVPAAELGAKLPLVVKGTSEEQRSLCLAPRLQAGVAFLWWGNRGGRSGPHWPQAQWPLARHSCPDLRLMPTAC